MTGRAHVDATPDGLGASTVDGRSRVVAVSVLVGVAVAVAWSFEFVDQEIGDNVANSLLGYDARGATIDGTVAGGLFAFVTGLAGTFTACNVAAFGAIAPMAGDPSSVQGGRLGRLVRPLGWLAAGMVAVSATYGAVGVLLADRLPQLSEATTAGGMPVRLVQSSVVFGVIGSAFAWLGLAAVGAVPDPLARFRRRFAQADLVVLGGLIGAFLIGRPFGLFFRMFGFAAEQGDPLYGAAAFVLQSLGNVVVMVAAFAAVVYARDGAALRWLANRPGRRARVTGGALLAAGTFTFVYWVLRVPAIFGYGWFPRMPWN